MPDPLTRQGFRQRLGPRPLTLLSRQIVADARDKKPGQPAPIAAIETLVERIGRAKARWLKRVIYDANVSSTGKCFAYAVADHLNCVTLDCWPSQARVAQLLGFKSAKTVQRAANELELGGYLTVTKAGRRQCRYAPKFISGDEDKSVRADSHKCPADPDKNVHESFISIQIKESASTTRAAEEANSGTPAIPYQRNQRGRVEIELAAQLGPNGFGYLARLSALDDRIVERMCRAYANGLMGNRELAAARLAADQA